MFRLRMAVWLSIGACVLALGAVGGLVVLSSPAETALAAPPPGPPHRPTPIPHTYVSYDFGISPDPAVRGAPLTYSITLKNSSGFDATDLDFTFTLAGETVSSVDLGSTGWQRVDSSPTGPVHITGSALTNGDAGMVKINIASFPPDFNGSLAARLLTVNYNGATSQGRKEGYTLNYSLTFSVAQNPPPTSPTPPPPSGPTPTPTPTPAPITDAQRAAFAAVAPFTSTDSHAYFPQTQHSISNGFKTYWETHGGLAMNGLPLSEEFSDVSPTDGQTYTTQYFERAVFEYHPGNPDPYKVELRLLGNLAGQRQPPAGQNDYNASLYDYYPQTGHWLGGLFRDYWNAEGGLAQFGYPIGEPQVVGAQVVQWFERQRLEITGGVSTIDGITLGLLGKEDAVRRGFPLTVA